jgi:uncharacterized membrane protein YtjA (UPF0391 family)
MLRWAYVLLLLAAVDGLLGIGGALAATGGGRARLVAYALLVVALIALSVASISRERDSHFWRPPPRRKREAGRRPARGRSMLTH